MSNLFHDSVKDPQGVQNNLLGPSYPYYKNIKAPSKIGMSEKGTIKAMTNDVNGLIQYVNLLVSGKSKASATGKPLGDKFFMKTGAKCAATDNCTDPNNISTCQKVDRYIYIDNVPSGNIPFISSGMGQDFTEFRGLIPGAMGNLNALNPFAIMRSFAAGSNPPCQELTMQTIDISNNRSTGTEYVTLADITSIDPCTFENKKNPVTKKKCKESFQSGVAKDAGLVLPDDYIDQLYFACLGGIGIYILYRIMEKSR
jgi:hypothetical protein